MNKSIYVKNYFFPIIFLSGTIFGYNVTKYISPESYKEPFIDVHLDFDEIDDNERNRRVPTITILSKKSDGVSNPEIDQKKLDIFQHFKITKTEKKSENSKWNNDIIYRFDDGHRITTDQDSEIYKDIFKNQCRYMQIKYLKDGKEKILDLNDIRKFD